MSIPIRYIICALPRSRTYWLSVALSTNGEKCLHDPLGSVHRVQDIPSCSGIADTGAMFFDHQLEVLHPNISWIVIKRDRQDVLASMRKLHWDTALIGAAEKELDRISKKATLVVPYDEIDIYRRDIWKACQIPGLFNEARWGALKKINLQTKASIYSPMLSTVRKQWVG